MRSVIFIAVMLLCAQPAAAELIEWKCNYTRSCQGQEQRCQKAKNFTLKYQTDTVTKKSVLVGNQGMSDVLAYGGEWGITYSELLPTGSHPDNDDKLQKRRKRSQPPHPHDG